MTAPPPGTVIRYAYLWANESATGRDEASKDRPALVLALAVLDENGETEVLVLAITHSPPRAPTDAIALPPEEKQNLGLDHLPSWIVTTEANTFIWPGPDIRPLPGPPPGRLIYGRISQPLLQRVARAYLVNRGTSRGNQINRTA